MGILLTFKKRKSSPRGKKVAVQPLKLLEVSLDSLEIEMALKLGDGDLSLGIRRAVVLAGMRQFYNGML